MKKIISMFLIFAMVFSFAACSSQTSGEDQAQQPAASESEGGADGTDADGASGNGSTLVVYFSATGNTETAAGYIAEATGGDLFEIQPAEPYTDDDLNWTDDNSRVTREQEDESLRDVELVADTVDNWEQYDTVFIGYPKIQYGFLSV